MAGTTTASLAIAIACFALVIFFSIPAINHFVRRLRKGKSQAIYLPDLYQDEDGSATPESESAYSDQVQRSLLVLGAVLGSIDALALAVLITKQPDLHLLAEQWLQLGTWLIVLLQAIAIYITPSSVTRYRLGILLATSCLAIVFAVAFENISLWQLRVIHPRNVHLTLSLIQWITAFALTFVGVLIPRRPDVYRNEKIVDRQNTVSAFGKYTFSWPVAILLYAVKNRSLGYDDLHEIHHTIRSRTLREDFETVGKTDKLWKTLFRAHKNVFIAQWTLQALCSITNFLPQIALYYILKALEERDAGANVNMRAWLLVVGLGAAVLFSSWIEAVMFFISFMKVGVPIYEQLSAVVFDKAIRRKDVKGANEKPDEKNTMNGEIVVNKDAGPKGEDEAVGDDDDEEDVQKTRQSTINLVGVDSKRISDFAMFNYIFLGSVIKFTFAVIFLVRLIGWIPMLAGFVAPLIITPINIYAAKKYAAYQDALMKYRDQKMAVVTEALQGIRQIKFSALEEEWYEKILDTRRKELSTQWGVFICDTCLVSIWIFGPVMLSAISLMTYASINKSLSASVAFTTISVFEAIEMTLAIIPEMVTDLLDCIVSASRVQKYLDSPDREEHTQPGPTIKFDATTVSWPSDNAEAHEDDFTLRKLDLEFPKHELSVVSGRTGSGKSLLLSSIIGEAEILEGTLFVPRAVRAAERYDAKATKASWLIPESIAFVAQIPWIENATIKDNILFGLPYDDDRYRKVLHVCALEKDLEMLEDADMTDIGANGINLSGGQKWRVSFARALYSRAGILVLDDIFSAVDANVGRHLFEQALTGDLGQGRTRILVTHHVALCLPKTTYSVLLANGIVELAGRTGELRSDGRLKAILAYDVEEQQKEDQAAEKQEHLTIDGGEDGLSKMMTNQSKRSRRASALSDAPDLRRRKSSAAIDNDNKVLPPKKFTEEERRETGSIKWKIYAEYIRACGGFSYWALIMFVFSVWIVAYLARSYWVSVWTRSYRTESTLSLRLLQQPGHAIHHVRSELSTVSLDPDLAYYLSVYLAISLACWLIGTVRYFSVFVASIRASKVLFENLASAVLRAPLRWLDVTPVGRILNRFTSDFNMLDSRISMDISVSLPRNLYQSNQTDDHCF